MVKLLLIISTCLLLFSCTSSDVNFEQVYDTTPVIQLVSISKEKMVEFDDSLFIVISYKDGDGDLGFLEPDSSSLQVYDSRLPNPDFYFVPPLAPINEELSISGELRFRIRGTFILGSGDTESTIFRIKLKDRSGNWSNTIETPEITFTRE